MGLSKDDLKKLLPTKKEINEEFPIFGGDDQVNYQTGCRCGVRWVISEIKRRIENLEKLSD